MLATYMRRMRDNNLEIRIAGSSCRPQKPKVTGVRADNDRRSKRFCWNTVVSVQSIPFILTGSSNEAGYIRVVHA